MADTRPLCVPFKLAKRLLADARAPIGSLRRNTDEFKKWEQQTTTSLETISGPKSRPVQEFSAIYFHYRVIAFYADSPPTPEHKHQEAFKEGIKEADNLLAALQEQVDIYEKVATENDRSERRKEAFAAMRKIVKAKPALPFPMCYVVRVLIASPSDLPKERPAATEVMNEWNGRNAIHEGVVLLSRLWEKHGVPQSGIKPQEAINKHLVDEADMLIAMFWTRLGTETDNAKSGTIEEIDRFVKAGKPTMIYFSNKPIGPSKLDTKQLEQLQQYRTETYNNSLVGHFASVADFRKQLDNHLTAQVRRLKTEMER